MDHPEKPVQALLSDKTGLWASLRDKLKHLERLNQLWQTHLDSVIAQHCRVANLRENILVIEVDSSVWVTRLRYLIPTLLKQLRGYRELHRLEAIEWYINPMLMADRTPSARAPAVFSAGSTELLAQTADTIENKALKAALRSLANTLKSCN